MLILGITGSIGMGKSTTASLFVEAGVPLFDADGVVHKLYKNDQQTISSIKANFPDAINSANQVDRTNLSRAVHKTPSGFAKLEALIHPKVKEARKKWLTEQQQAGEETVLFDIPLLYETKAENEVDLVLVVDAPKQVQTKRVLARKNMDAIKLEQILARQIPNQQKKQRADYIIRTDKGLAHARLQVGAILRHIESRNSRADSTSATRL